MTTKRKVLSLLLVMLLVLFSVMAVSCGDDKTEWPEAGLYTFADGNDECTLVLNEGDTFTIVYKNSSESGTYTLTDEKLVLEFNSEDKDDVTAVFADTVITLTYDGASMRLLKKVNYTVTFNANGGSATASQSVVNGKLPAVPENPTRSGYDFIGWYADSEFKTVFNFEAPVTANVTVYAKWEKLPVDTKLPEPVINVTSTLISWNSIAGARSYALSIIAPDGEVVYEATTSSTLHEVSFEQFEAAIYTVRVTAIANSGEQDNSTEEVTYNHKALAKVDGFKVDGGLMLVYNTVENAEKYYVTVVCGNSAHNHTSFDNGSNRFFDISRCPMTADGIKVTVTAVADGYASSTSDEFVYKRELAKVEGLRYDDATGNVLWNAVDNATGYMVSVKCGDTTHNHDFLNVGNQTFVNLNECASLEGGIVIKVYPVTDGYISPAASEFKYTKTKLQTPASLTVNGTLISWSTVSTATRYEVKINGSVHNTTTASFDMSSVLNWVEGTEYVVSVRAVSADNESAWTDDVKARYYEMGDKVSYSKSTLTWAPVIGVEGFEVQVNDGEIVSVAGGKLSASVVLTKSGVNTVKVRFVDGKFRSEWKSVEVYAHEVVFDTLGGSEIVVQYKAVGDTMVLPTPTKTGYKFIAWYNIPGGAASNGKVYDDDFFAGSGSMVLYAQYEANEYDVTYNYGIGGTGTAESGKVKYENNYTLDVPTANEPTSAFGGWFSAPYGMGVQYTDAEGNSLAPWNTLGGAEMYAFWIDHTLEFVQTKLNGQNVYAVTKGERIALVSEVTIPETYRGLPVALVSGNAFLNCTNLKVINIPSSVQQISNVTPFGGCTALTEVNVYKVEGVSARYWSEDGVLFDNGADGAQVAKLVFMPLAKTGTYRIPAGVAEIPQNAFANASVSKVVVPASVTKIGKGAFASCKQLVSIVFETAKDEQPLLIAARAFENCTSLSKIILPARLAEIKLQKYSISGNTVNVDTVDNAFAGCTSLVSITVASANASYKSVDGVLYSKDGKTLLYCPATKLCEDGKFAVPAGVQVIAPGAFVDCTSVKEIAIPNTVVNVGECAFYGLANLKKVTFAGGSLTDLTIGKYAFRDCLDLSEIVLETGSRLAVISEGAFFGCESIESFQIPATVTDIKADAFRNCTDLESINFAANGKTLAFGENVFAGCTSLTSVNLPANVSAVPGIFSGCTSLTTVTVDENSEYFTSVDGVLFNKAKTEIVFFPQGKSGEYTLPATVTTIANGVFNNVRGITTLTIGNAVTLIGEDAFRGASFDSIVFTGEATGTLTIAKNAFNGATVNNMALPTHTREICEGAFERAIFTNLTLNEGIVTLGDRAFYYASGSVTVPASVKAIGAYCFAGEDGGYYYPDYGASVTLTVDGSVLETIGDYAFYENPFVTEAVIPASVVSIGNHAFYGCAEISEITFTLENSKLKTIGAYAFSATSSYYAPEVESLTIPKSVTAIGAYAFANLPINSVEFEAGGTEDLVLGVSYLEVYQNSIGQTITNLKRGNVFYYCEDLSTVVLPNRLVEIGMECFKYAGYYTTLSVTFNPDDEGDIRLATIGERAFQSSKLTSFVIPKSVRNLDPVVELDGNTYDRLGIGAEAFDGCYSKLTSITFEEGGTAPLTIGAKAFNGCSRLASMALPARLAPYASSTGETLNGLADNAGVFNDCSSMASVTLQGEDAYYVCVDGVVFSKDMTEVVYYPVAKEGNFTVPASVTKIHDKAFYGAEALTAVTFEGGTADMTIGYAAFAYCSSLETLLLPDNVVSLGASTFYGCYSLTTLTISKNLTSFTSGMIEGCSALAEINVSTDGAGVVYSSQNGVLFNADKTTLIFFPAKNEATEYTVPATVKVIASGAFMANKNLVSVILPEGLVEINLDAFNSCASLEEINIPSTVTLIAKNAFRSSKKLETVTFDEGGNDVLVINEYAFAYTNGLVEIEFPSRLGILGNNVFETSGVSVVTFGDGCKLTAIGDELFANSALEEITFPAGIVTIGNETFFGCKSLTKVTFGEGTVSIGDRTFAQASDIEEVHFPSSLKTLGNNTFYYYDYDPYTCSNLRVVTFGENSQLEAIPAGTFAYTNLINIEIPASVKEIADRVAESSDPYHEEYPGAFDGCANLVSVTFAQGSVCEKIGDSAFYECKKLQSADIPATVSTLGAYAFYNCEALESVVIPSTVTQLGESLFYSCDNLSTVILNTKATVFPSYLFYNCKKLTSIVIPEGVSTIGSACFDGTGITEITLPASVQAFSGYGMFANCENLEKVTILGNVTAIARRMFEDCVKLSEINLPSSVETIDEDAFYNCVSLTEFTIPAALTSFDLSAFDGSALEAYYVAEGNETFKAVGGVLYSADMTKIVSYPVSKTDDTFTVPNTVTFIGEGTFYGVTALKTILFEEGGLLELEIGEYAFYGFTSLTKVVLPDRIGKIGDEAFAYCLNLLSINIPEGMEEDDFGADAFYSCTKLVEICNKSDIELEVGDGKCGGLTDYAVRIYSEGESTANLDEDGYITIEVDGEVYLVAYTGEATELVIPAGVTVINPYTFQELEITSVVLPAGLKVIGEGAFYYCQSLQTVEMADSVTTIGEGAFYYCNYLSDIELPESLVTIDDYAFYYCKKISVVNLPEGLETIGEKAFYYCDISTIEFPSTLTSIGKQAFYYTSLSGNIAIGINVTTIGENAFYYTEDTIKFLVAAAEKPDGWSEKWNVEYSGWSSTDYHEVLWGFTGEDVTYTFVTGEGGSVVENIVSGNPINLPADPTREGYIFGGWYDNDAFEGEPVGNGYYNSVKNTLYAKWLTQAEFDALYAGTTPQYGIAITAGESSQVTISNYGEKVWYKITVSETGNYKLYSSAVSGDDDTMATLYDDPDGYSLKTADRNESTGDWNHFYFEYQLEAGKTYYIQVYYFSSYTGVFDFHVEAA